MKIDENIHLIRKDFYVTDEVKRYVNLYLITGEKCYLIDSGVAGSEELVADYMQSIGRHITDIQGIFLTHAHPDHIGAAAEIKRRSGCEIFAPAKGLSWIENIERQFAERPIPNFFYLLSESVHVEHPLFGEEVVECEQHVTLKVMATPGHSDDSISYILNDRIIFIGDAIPAANDLPIFVNYEKSMESIEKIQNLSGVEKFCPAWDNVYHSEQLKEIAMQSKERLCKLKRTVCEVDEEFYHLSVAERNQEVCKRLGMQNFFGNPLFITSIEACRVMY